MGKAVGVVMAAVGGLLMLLDFPERPARQPCIQLAGVECPMPGDPTIGALFAIGLVLATAGVALLLLAAARVLLASGALRSAEPAQRPIRRPRRPVASAPSTRPAPYDVESEPGRRLGWRAALVPALQAVAAAGLAYFWLGVMLGNGLCEGEGCAPRASRLEVTLGYVGMAVPAVAGVLALFLLVSLALWGAGGRATRLIWIVLIADALMLIPYGIALST